MMNKKRASRPVSLLAAAAAAIASTLPAPATAATMFDGRWSVRLDAQNGVCPDRTVRIRVANGRISYAGPGRATASGTIGAGGAVRVSFATRRDVLNARGAVRGLGGSGRWTSPTRGCTGVWAARRS